MNRKVLREQSKLVPPPYPPTPLFPAPFFYSKSFEGPVRTRPGGSGERDATDLEVGAVGDGTAQRWDLARTVRPRPIGQRQQQRQQQRSESGSPAGQGNETPAPC